MVNEDVELHYSDDPDDKVDKYKEVWDNCHLRKKYRGSVHNICNLNLKLPQNMPIACNNMS